VKYRFMNEHRRDYAITLMCRVLRVARAGFYSWLQEPVSDHAKEDARLLDLIRDSYRASHGVYGARRIFGDLREVGEVCGFHRVERLMRENGIKPVRGYKKPRAIAGRPSIIAPNHLQRAFTVEAPNKGLGDRHNLCQDLAGLALPGSRRRSCSHARLSAGR